MFKYMFTYYSFANTTIPQYDMSKLIAALSSGPSTPMPIGGGLQFEKAALPGVMDAGLLIDAAGSAITKPSGGTHMYLFCQDAKDIGEVIPKCNFTSVP